MKKILFCGGREFSDAKMVEMAMDRILVRHGRIVVVHGGAKGADTLAGNSATRRRLPVWVFHADWALGRIAGPARNQEMLDVAEPDGAVAFPGGRGTADMVRRCHDAGVPVWTVTK